MTAVALIPPYDFLALAMQRPLQMMLPACLQSYTYRHVYELKPRVRPGYVILDNGMFEGTGSISNHGLLEMAAEYHVQEVVMPDVRDDAFATCQAIKEFLITYETYKRQSGKVHTLMAVVQGETADDREACLYEFAGLASTVRDMVIGFPRRLTEKGPDTRMATMTRAHEILGRTCRFHMLGLSRQWPGEFLMAKQKFGDLLRGIDTDAPFVWAYYDMPLQATAANAERPGNYFRLTEHEISQSMLHYNISVMESWAEGLKAPVEA